MVLQENRLWNWFMKPLDFCDTQNLLFVIAYISAFWVSFLITMINIQLIKNGYLNKIILFVTVKIYLGDDKVFSNSLPFSVNFHGATQKLGGLVLNNFVFVIWTTVWKYFTSRGKLLEIPSLTFPHCLPFTLPPVPWTGGTALSCDTLSKCLAFMQVV